MVQKKDRTASPRLTAADFGDDVVRCVFEPLVQQDDLLTVRPMASFGQYFSKVFDVGGFDVDEVVPEVEA